MTPIVSIPQCVYVGMKTNSIRHWHWLLTKIAENKHGLNKDRKQRLTNCFTTLVSYYELNQLTPQSKIESDELELWFLTNRTLLREQLGHG